MMIKTSILALGASLLAASLVPAHADSLDRDIRADRAQLRRDQQAVAADEARIAHERREIAEGHAAAREDFREGHPLRALGDMSKRHHDERELRAEIRKLNEDRARLQRDRHDLHEDIERRHGS